MSESTFQLTTPKPTAESRTKYNHIVSHRPSDIASLMGDILMKTDLTDPYMQSKMEIINHSIMGQTLSNHLEELKDDVVKEAHILKEVIDITHEEFEEKVRIANKICRKVKACEGRHLKFFVKKGSDATFFWKQTVRIVCMRVNITDDSAALFCDESIDEESLNNVLATTDREIEVHKLLGLRQFLLAFNMITYHFNCMQADERTEEERKNEYLSVKPISTSMILDKIMNEAEAETESEECIICMERKPEITLPCAHAYCLFCIEQWNVSNRTCPVCRAAMENTDDSWVTPEIPNRSEVNAEIQKALTVLTLKLPEK
ncbi:RING finger protein 141 [Caerostris darwini]|uniref:RING finger protein 141 n=1 Tax=Caerostris darwini TaxID=1538125 RepID=A0AAV4RFA0_9ARAC|nr:RING finger protein 141 [Caerostris darwini]